LKLGLRAMQAHEVGEKVFRLGKPSEPLVELSHK